MEISTFDILCLLSRNVFRHLFSEASPTHNSFLGIGRFFFPKQSRISELIFLESAVEKRSLEIENKGSFFLILFPYYFDHKD